MVWIYKKNRVIPDSCDVLIARNEEESHIEHLVPTKNPQKMKTPNKISFRTKLGTLPSRLCLWWWVCWLVKKAKHFHTFARRKSSQISEKMELFYVCFFFFIVVQTSFWKTTLSSVVWFGANNTPSVCVGWVFTWFTCKNNPPKNPLNFNVPPLFGLSDHFWADSLSRTWRLC